MAIPYMEILLIPITWMGHELNIYYCSLREKMSLNIRKKWISLRKTAEYGTRLDSAIFFLRIISIKEIMIFKVGIAEQISKWATSEIRDESLAKRDIL